MLPHCKTLLQKPYLNAFNYVNASGKKPGSLYLRYVTWTSQTHKFNGNKSFYLKTSEDFGRKNICPLVKWLFGTRSPRQCLGSRLQEGEGSEVCFLRNEVGRPF